MPTTRPRAKPLASSQPSISPALPSAAPSSYPFPPPPSGVLLPIPDGAAGRHAGHSQRTEPPRWGMRSQSTVLGGAGTPA